MWINGRRCSVHEFWRAGEGRLKAKHAQADDGAEAKVYAQLAGMPVGDQPDTRTGSSLLKHLAAKSLTASALISLTLL